MDGTLPPSHCPGCRQRDARIAQLERRVAQLERKLDDALRAGKRQAAPFRRQSHVEKPKPPGRHEGHPPAERAVPTKIDRVIDVPIESCPDCHVPLEQRTVHVQYQTDLPPIQPIVTQFNIQAGTCPCCGRYRQGRHAEQISDAVGAAGNQIGPVALGMAAELKHRLGVPYAKVCDLFETYFQISICPGTLARADQRLARLARPTYDFLIDALRRSGVVHSDETGWRISRVNAWLWVFASPTVTVYAIRTSRGHEVPEEILGPDFGGVLVVDGLGVYDALEYVKGRCAGHVLRRSVELAETATPTDRLYLQDLITLFREAIDLAARRETLTPGGYERRVQEIENRFDAWLDFHGRRPGAELEKLAWHLADHRWQWFLFLYDEAVPATNNHAERMIRPAVIARKTGGCNKTLAGALAHAILSSVLVTCKQAGQSFVELVRRLFCNPEPLPIPLLSSPDG